MTEDRQAAETLFNNIMGAYRDHFSTFLNEFKPQILTEIKADINESGRDEIHQYIGSTTTLPPTFTPELRNDIITKMTDFCLEQLKTLVDSGQISATDLAKVGVLAILLDETATFRQFIVPMLQSLLKFRPLPAAASDLLLHALPHGFPITDDYMAKLLVTLASKYCTTQTELNDAIKATLAEYSRDIGRKLRVVNAEAYDLVQEAAARKIPDEQMNEIWDIYHSLDPLQDKVTKIRLIMAPAPAPAAAPATAAAAAAGSSAAATLDDLRRQQHHNQDTNSLPSDKPRAGAARALPGDVNRNADQGADY